MESRKDSLPFPCTFPGLMKVLEVDLQKVGRWLLMEEVGWKVWW
jgi:hypothetical protein